MGEYIVCAGGGLRQRETPGGRYMQMIPDGTRIRALDERDGCIKVRHRGYVGWVSAEYCALADGND